MNEFELKREAMKGYVGGIITQCFADTRWDSEPS